MAFSRRRLMQWAASMIAPGTPTPRRFVPASHSQAVGSLFRPELLPSKKEIWDHHTIDKMSAGHLKRT